jgi:hypothetical protein
MSDDPKSDYEVGYGKPPKSSRFKKGQPSPNPKGRPKKAASIMAAVQESLEQTVPVTMADGKKRRMRKVEVIAAKITNDAVSGKIQSQRLIVSLEQKSGSHCRARGEENSKDELTPEEAAERQRFYEKQLIYLNNFKTAKCSGMFDNDSDGRLFATPISKPIIDLVSDLRFSQIRDVAEFKSRREIAVRQMLEALNEIAFNCLRPWNFRLQKSDLE